jgi:hypothetical protein
MERYGLVFKIWDQCWLSEFINGTAEDASPIDDEEGAYEDLGPCEMSLVEIKSEGETDSIERVYLKDLKTITIEHDDPEKSIVNLIEEGGFPELAKAIFEDEDLSKDEEDPT